MKVLLVFLVCWPLLVFAQQQDVTGGIGGTGANEEEEMIGGIGGTGLRDMERPELLERPTVMEVREALDDASEIGSEEMVPEFDRPDDTPTTDQ